MNVNLPLMEIQNTKFYYVTEVATGQLNANIYRYITYIVNFKAS